MAVKTIRIDTEAYGRLKSAQQPNESFSETIKRRIPAPFDMDAWLAKMGKDPLSTEALDAIEQRVAERRKPSRRER